MESFDSIDTAIINALQKNARASYREIAAETKVAVGTVQNRLNKLKESGVLKGFKPIIDYEKLGYNFNALVALRVKRADNTRITEKLIKDNKVQRIYWTLGDYDLFLRMLCKNQNEMKDFLQTELSDDAITETVTYSIVQKVEKN